MNVNRTESLFRESAQQAHLKALHGLWASESGRPLPYSRERGMRWVELVLAIDNMEVTHEKAVILVAQRIKNLSRQFAGWQHHLDFNRFTQTDVFLDHLCAALAEARKPKASNAPQVREDWRKPKAPPPPEGQPVSTVLESMKLADKLKQWREKNL